jgi:ADP-heptose:LPS heptosyltransferase
VPRILVVKLTALGDVVQALTALGRVRPHVPDGLVVDWAVDGKFAALLAGQPWLRRVVGVTPGVLLGRRGPRAAVRAIADLRAGGPYDLVVDLQGRLKSWLVGRAAGGSRRTAYSRAEAVGPWRIRSHVGAPRARHAVDLYTDVLAASLGVPAPTGGFAEPAAPMLAVGADVSRQLDGWLAERGVGAAEPLVLALPGGAWPTKLVPVDTLVASVAPLAARGARLLALWGGEAERVLASRVVAGVAEAVRSGPRPLLLPKLTLPGLAALGARVAVTVGGDTGPLYVAAAQGSATVALFGPTPAGRTAPRGPAHAALYAEVPCGPCFKRRCPTGHFICLPGISADAVARAALDRLVVKPSAVRS